MEYFFCYCGASLGVVPAIFPDIMKQSCKENRFRIGKIGKDIQEKEVFFPAQTFEETDSLEGMPPYRINVIGVELNSVPNPSEFGNESA